MQIRVSVILFVIRCYDLPDGVYLNPVTVGVDARVISTDGEVVTNIAQRHHGVLRIVIYRVIHHNVERDAVSVRQVDSSVDKC